MENSDELLNALVKSAALVLPILASIVVYYLKGYVQILGVKANEEIGTERLTQLMWFADLIVRSAEQVVGLEGDEAKKDYALGKIKTLRDEYGLPLSDDQLDDLIEGIYNGIKDEIKKPPASLVRIDP